MRAVSVRVSPLVFGAGLAVMVAASIWAPAPPELITGGACNVAVCGTLEDPQRWRTAWFVWGVGAVMTLGATAVMARRQPGSGWLRVALAALIVISLPITAAIGAVVSLLTSVHGFGAVMWTFTVLPLAALAFSTVHAMSDLDQRRSRADTAQT